MTFGTSHPFTRVIAAVYWKILTIVIESGWSPCGLIMAVGTFGGKLKHLMVRISSAFKILLVAAQARIWGIVVISTMAHGAFIAYSRMRTI
jgi:hypothetical protein